MSKLLLNQLAGTNMAYNRFSFDYFLDSMQRLGIRDRKSACRERVYVLV